MYNNSEILMLLQKYFEIIMRGVHSNNIYLSSKLLKADCYTLKKRSCIRYTYKQTLITYLHYIRLIDKAPHRNPSLNVAQHSMYFLLLYSYICIRYSYSTHLISMNLNICCLPKGQLISKYPFDVIVSTKIPTKKFDNFCPKILKSEKSAK